MKRTKKSTRSDYLYEEFSQRITKKYLFCFQSSENNLRKFERIHNYCKKHGFILNHSTIDVIQKSFFNMIRSALDKKKTHDLKLQLTHVNALPSRTERGLFLIMELGNLLEDVRYSLISLLGKQIPSYEILHSRGANLPEQIRRSLGRILIDRLTFGLKDFLEEISLKDTLPQSLQLGLLVHFPLKQNELNHAVILSWSNRFDCPDLLDQDLINLLHQSFEQNLSKYRITITACLQESVAALISVAFQYPNTFLSLIFDKNFQLSFIEDTEIFRSKNLFQQIQLRALYRTIVSLNFQYVHSKQSNQCHALFQTILTSIDIHLIQQLNVNYFDVFTCDFCLLEIFRLLIIELSIHEKFLPDINWSNSKLNQIGSIDLKFVSLLLQSKYSKLEFYLNQLNLKDLTKYHLIQMEYLFHLLIRRSTQILSCLIVCLADRYNKEDLTIAIDSYLYRSCPIYQIYMHKEIEYLCKQWITMFHFVIPTNKSYLGPAVVMGLQKTQKAMINQDDNMIRLHIQKKSRRQLESSREKSHS